MSIFGFLFFLGVINIIFSFVWKWVFMLPMAIILTVTRLDKYGMSVVKIFGTYLLVSLTALLTLAALSNEPSGFAVIFYPLIGAFVLLMGLANGQYEARKEARQNNDWELMQMLDQNANFEVFLIFGAILFYVLALFVPAVSTNALVSFLFNVVDWAYNLPIIGLLLGIGGILFLINIIFYGLIAAGGIVAFALGKMRGKKAAEPKAVI